MKTPALVSAVPLLVSSNSTVLIVNPVPSDTEEDNSEDEASTTSTTQLAQAAPSVAKAPSHVNNDGLADSASASSQRLRAASEGPNAHTGRVPAVGRLLAVAACTQLKQK